MFDRPWRRSLSFMGFGGDGSQPSSSNSVTRPGLSDSGMHTSRVQPLDVLIWPPAESPLGPLEASEQHNPEVYQSCTIDQLLQRYKFGNVLGVGGFAVVKRAVDLRTNEQVAIKIVEKCRYQLGDHRLEREISILRLVDHPNCIKLYNVYHTQTHVYIVTELVNGGELLDRITELGNYSEDMAARIIQQILSGVAYLHARGIVHRDLKLENLVLLNDRMDSPVKIADFGISKMLEPSTLLKTICGSPQYVAPEVLAVGDTIVDYTPAVDIWSVGVILFILLSGYSPFDDDNEAVLFDRIRKGLYDIDDPVWESVSELAKDLVAKLLTVDVSKRLSAKEALMHPWLALHCGGCLEMQADDAMADNS